MRLTEESGSVNDPYYKTAKHRRWRAAVLRRDKFLCQECAKYGRRVMANHAHHIIPRKMRPDLSLALSNGISLCGPCHNKIEPRANT